MADNALSQLYPQPPQPSQGLMTGDPSKLLSIMPGLADFGAKQAVGNALQQSTDGQGNVDIGGFQSRAAQNPTAALRMMEAVQFGQQQKTQQFELANAQRAQVGNIIAAYGSRPDATPKGAIDFVTRLARVGVDPRHLQEFKDTLLSAKDPQEFKQKISDIEMMLLGSSGRSAIGEGPVDPATGQRPLQPAATILRDAYGNPTGGRPKVTADGAPMSTPGATSVPPGEAEYWRSSAERGSRLLSTASTSAQYHADLDNLKQESKVLDNIGGPTVEFEKKANQFLTRVGAPGLGTMTPEQLRAVESFDKIALNVSAAQAGVFGASTDAGRHMMVGANPSSSMSAYGREGVIDMLQGNQDATDRARQLWADAKAKGAPAHYHDTFMNKLTEHDPENGKIGFDPRVFQFNRLDRKNQQKFLSQMDPTDIAEFEQKYRDAVAKKWVKPLKKSVP